MTINQEQRNSYNQALQNVAAPKEALIPVEQQVNLAKEYEGAFTKAGISLKDFKDKVVVTKGEAEALGETIRNDSRGDITCLFKNFSKNKEQINDHVNSIQNQVKQLKNTLSKDGEKPLFATKQFDNFYEKVEGFRPEAKNAKLKILEIRNAAEVLETTVTSANNAHLLMDDNINEQERLRASLDLTIQKANELKESFQQEAGIQSAVDMAGQLGRAIVAVTTSTNGLKLFGVL